MGIFNIINKRYKTNKWHRLELSHQKQNLKKLNLYRLQKLNQ